MLQAIDHLSHKHPQNLLFGRSRRNPLACLQKFFAWKRVNRFDSNLHLCPIPFLTEGSRLNIDTPHGFQRCLAEHLRLSIRQSSAKSSLVPLRERLRRNSMKIHFLRPHEISPARFFHTLPILAKPCAGKHFYAFRRIALYDAAGRKIKKIHEEFTRIFRHPYALFAVVYAIRSKMPHFTRFEFSQSFFITLDETLPCFSLFKSIVAAFYNISNDLSCIYFPAINRLKRISTVALPSFFDKICPWGSHFPAASQKASYMG